MNKSTKIESIILETSDLKDRKLARKVRSSVLNELHKLAQAEGILQHYTSDSIDYKTREQHQVERGGQSAKQLYGVGLPDRKNVDLSTKVYRRSLSTRYSPDRVGVQARRVSDGVYQDPITNKVYNWNEGFTTEDGSKFFGGDVSLQTDIVYHE
jgi:hypothetical protein